MKTALVTGATSGIGYEFAKLHASKGGNLVIVARNSDELNTIKSDFEKRYGISVLPVPKDLSVVGSAAEVYNLVKENGITVDYLINNAGFGTFGKYSETDWQKELEMMNVNMIAVAHFTKLFLKDMVARGEGRILNISSIAAFQPGPLMAMYYSTKAFVLHFSESVAEEVAGTGVTVTALCPGPMETGFGENSDLENSKLMSSLPLQSPEDCAKLGYDAMLKGKRVAIHGVVNTVLAESTRFVPRKLAAKMAMKIQEKKK